MIHDENKITHLRFLPSEVHIVMEAYKIKNNYVDFLNKFDLQHLLTKDLIEKTTSNTAIKIKQKKI